LSTYVPITDYINLGDLIHHLPFPRGHASPQHTYTHTHPRNIPTGTSPQNTRDLQIRQPGPKTVRSTRPGQISSASTPPYTHITHIQRCNPSHSPNRQRRRRRRRRRRLHFA
ncbi:hypothetical protein CORC01_11242, partial [Colletotrichum orchidophilum]